MKTWILAATMLAGVTLTAQTPDQQPAPGGKPRAERPVKERIPAEQRASIAVKEFTLALDLTDKQVKEIEPLFLAFEKKKDEIIEKRQAARNNNVKPTAEERAQMKVAFLDEKIKLKRDLKKILTADQYKNMRNSLRIRALKKKDLSKSISLENRNKAC